MRLMCKGCPQVKWWYFNIIWLVRVQYMCEVCVYVCVCDVPRAILSTLIILMIVGLMGRAALISISSSVMPITDSSTMAKSNWFHLPIKYKCTTSETLGVTDRSSSWEGICKYWVHKRIYVSCPLLLTETDSYSCHLLTRVNSLYN